MSVATGWEPSVVWRTSYGELELVGAALMRRSGKPYRKPLSDAEREEKADVRATMEQWGVIQRGHDK